MSEGDDRDKIDTMLRHIGIGQGPQDFPGTQAEKLGLIRVAGARGLVAWSKARGRYELTSLGWRQAGPRRGFGLASLAISTAIGAVIGASALGVLWLPADASHHSVGRQAKAPISRPVDTNGGLPTPPQTASLLPAVPKVQTDPVPTAQPIPTEPARVAEQPVPTQPSATATPTGTKHAAVKKPRHKTAQARTYRTWAGANSPRANLYRDERYVR
jgi:hypothetical protein